MNLLELYYILAGAVIVLCIVIPIVRSIKRESERAAKALAMEREAEARRIEAERKAAEKAQREAEAAAQAEAEKAERKRVADERKRQAAAKRAQREAEQVARQDAKVQAAREIAEYKERALKAERELMALRRASIRPATPQAMPESPIVNAPAPVVAPAAKPEPPKPEAPAIIAKGNEAFVGQVVAFTGTLPGMKRKEAIAAVVANGGKAYETMTAGTTLLLVGDKPGAHKMDLADRWIGQVRKITPLQFKEMVNQPLTLTPDEFAARFAPLN